MTDAGMVYLFSLLSSLCVLFGVNYLVRRGSFLVAKILGFQFLLVGFLVAVTFFIMPENILHYPHFFRILAPFHYALPPLNFLFFWYLFHPNEKFNKFYLLFFIPFIFQVVEYIPFYVSPREIKIEEIKWMISQGNFFAYNPKFMWIDPVVHNYLKFTLGTIFCVLMGVYYLQFKTDQAYKGLFQNQLIHTWILGILLFRIGLIVYSTYLYSFSDLGKFDSPNYILLAEFFNIFYLALHPNLLDVKILSEKLDVRVRPLHHASKEEDGQLYSLASKMEKYFEETQVFLNSQLTVELLGKFTGHPHRLISHAIKYKHGVPFRDFLNNYRITYFEKKMQDPNQANKSSMENMIRDAGFGSRQSFYTAFKKAKGCTPKDYFNSK
ncbi:MAG: hypothetical protein RLZZ207_1016 [Bacteroidota bacterium]